MNEELKQKIDRAHKELDALCNGKRFEMFVPARPDTDSDLVIGDGLRAGMEAIKQLEIYQHLADVSRRLLDNLYEFGKPTDSIFLELVEDALNKLPPRDTIWL